MVIVDTNVLMHETRLEELLEEFEGVHIPVEVLAELDHLKSQEGERGYLARCAVRSIKENFSKIDFLIHGDVSVLNRNNLIVDDIIIEHCNRNPGCLLVTNDINMEVKASAIGIKTINFFGKEAGEKEYLTTVEMTNEDFIAFVVCGSDERLNEIPVGQFVIIKEIETGTILGVYRFLQEGMWDPIDESDTINNYSFSVSPWDTHQACAIKSLKDDEFTVITGPAGSGKTLLSLGYALEMMDKNGSTINIFVNPAKTRNSEELGYYPGSRDEKLLSNFIGGILMSKLGDSEKVCELLATGRLRVYPFSDIRGMEIPKGDVMYITEAQNLSVDLIKLAIQRCASGSKLIVEGDYKAQVDNRHFEGSNNGLQRVIDVFTGTQDCDFGYVNLPNVHRSSMAEKAEEL